jgi:hypothetical protein
VFHNNSIALGIESYDNVIPDTKSFIQNIEDHVLNKRLSWSNTDEHSTNYDGSLRKARSCQSISLPPYELNKELIINSTTDKTDFISLKKTTQLSVHNFLNDFLYKPINVYKEKYDINQWSDPEGWQILKYEEGHYVENHYDDGKKRPRTLSMCFYLNEDYEGGEIEFPRLNLKFKPKENQMIVFPSNYIYNHIVNPVTKGKRYAIVGWWN